MRIKLFAVAAILAAQPVMPATASFRTGNDLYLNCSADKDDQVYYQKNASCIAYIIGAVDTFELMQRFLKAPECLPAQSTSGQMRDVVVKFLRDHPEKRANAGSMIVAEALVDGFGCSLSPKS